MTELSRGITARLFIKALHRDGFSLSRTRGSHRIYRHPDGRRVVVAFHRFGDTFPIGTLRSMSADIGLAGPRRIFAVWALSGRFWTAPITRLGATSDSKRRIPAEARTASRRGAGAQGHAVRSFWFPRRTAVGVSVRAGRSMLCRRSGSRSKRRCQERAPRIGLASGSFSLQYRISFLFCKSGAADHEVE